MSKKYELYDSWSKAEEPIKRFKYAVFRKLYAPFLLLVGNSPSAIFSVLAMLLGIVAALSLAYSTTAALLLILFSLFVDGFDGTLARHTKKTTAGTSILDNFGDMVVVLATTAGFVFVQILNPIVGMLYACFYPISIIFTMVTKNLRVPSQYVLRPRLLVFGAFALYAILGIHYLTEVTLVVTILLGYFILRDFLKIYQKLR